MKERWFMRAIKGDFDGISKVFSISKITARVLVNRGISEKNDIGYFLEAEKRELPSPAPMKDLKEACTLLHKKIKEHKKIRIIGDYDVDGVCSTYILYDFFKRVGADISYAIPHRVHDGYGISFGLIDNSKSDGIDTLITCDNGIAAYEEVKYAKEMGLTVIITDHHDIPKDKPLPPADTVTDPKRSDCDYGFEGLCGAGVVYQLVNYYTELYPINGLGKQAIEKRYIEVTALATICDVMELIKENRTIVKRGLKALKATENIGIRAMLEVSGLFDKEQITVYHCGFILGPMINASGRLKTAKKAIDLLLENDTKKALERAEELKTLNEDRKSITEVSSDMAFKIATSSEYKKDTVLVIYLPECHESIAGIVAGRIKEKFYKPTIILTNGENGIKGSGRSIEDYNMFDELSRCSECFSKFGGHPMAAGLSLKGETRDEQLKNLEKLRTKLNKISTLTEEELTPRIYFDMELPPRFVTEALINEFKLLEPYGTGNKSPAFATKNLHVQNSKILGKNENVLKIEFTDEISGKIFEAIYFGEAKELENYISQKGKNINIIYIPQINEFNGRKTIQFKIENYY